MTHRKGLTLTTLCMELPYLAFGSAEENLGDTFKLQYCRFNFLGIHIPSDAYIPAGLIIIPINSALNPLLYSDLLDVVMEKLTGVKRLLCPSSDRKRDEVDLVRMGEKQKRGLA